MNWEQFLCSRIKELKKLYRKLKLHLCLSIGLSSLLLMYLCLSGCGHNSVSGKQGNSNSIADKDGNDSAEVLINGPQIVSAAFIGTDTAWFVPVKGDYLLRTDDGGVSWNKIPAEPLGRLSHISFIDLHRGWAINVVGQVWRTIDGGSTWTAIAKLTSDDSEWAFNSAHQIDFVDELHGWIIETFSIWRTEDGGMSWKRVFSPDSLANGQPTRGFFLDAVRGWVCSSRGGKLYLTNDGKTWHSKTVDGNTDLLDVFFIDEINGWLNYSNGQLYRTKDGGKTWHSLPKLNKEIDVNLIFFLNKSEGWAVGRGISNIPSGFTQEHKESKAIQGFVLHTTDGGQSWQSVHVGEGELLFNRLYFGDAQHGWLHARNNVYRTNDGGESWRTVLKLSPIK